MNKLFGASVLVLGLALSQAAFAFGPSSETESEGTGNAAASTGGTAVSAQINDNKLFSDNKSITTINKDESKHVIVAKDQSTHSTTDESTHFSIGDISLALETNKAVSKATLANATIGNFVNQEAKYGHGVFKTEASMGEGAASGWAGISQVNITAGSNNVAEMNQQVTANLRTVNLN